MPCAKPKSCARRSEISPLRPQCRKKCARGKWNQCMKPCPPGQKRCAKNNRCSKKPCKPKRGPSNFRSRWVQAYVLNEKRKSGGPISLKKMLKSKDMKDAWKKAKKCQ